MLSCLLLESLGLDSNMLPLLGLDASLIWQLLLGVDVVGLRVLLLLTCVSVMSSSYRQRELHHLCLGTAILCLAGVTLVADCAVHLWVSLEISECVAQEPGTLLGTVAGAEYLTRRFWNVLLFESKVWQDPVLCTGRPGSGHYPRSFPTQALCYTSLDCKERMSQSG